MDVNQYYSFKESPFHVSPDYRFLYLSEQVQEALAKCEYLSKNRVGPIYMSGPIGSGKTTIVRYLFNKLSEDKQFNIQLIISPNLKSSNAFLREIMEEFEVKTERSYGASLDNFKKFLLAQHQKGKIPVLLIDEAQNLTRDALKLIHFLLNYETDKYKLLQIILVGQESLQANILRYRELASRMFPIATQSMTLKDLTEMIKFRWSVAGGKIEELPFKDDNIAQIYKYSMGLPRDAVKLCSELLLVMANNQSKSVSTEEIERIAKSQNLIK